MLGWIFNAAYLTLLAIAAPWLLFRAIVRGWRFAGWREKCLGDVAPRTGSGKCVWFHAVSVGEVLQLELVLTQLAAVRPDLEFVISTTTATGREVALKKYASHRVIYFPLDFTWAVDRAFERIRPSAIVLVELELWPNFIFAAARKGTPVALINGRMSERSHRGYRRLRPLVSRVLRCLSLIAVQNETYAERLRDLLGDEPRSRIHVTGSIKFDRVSTDRANPKTQELRSAFGLHPDEPLFIAGSTQDPEERFALQTWLAVRDRHPTLRLMLVPRHKERFDDVANLVAREFQLPLIRRSEALAALHGSSRLVSACPPVLLLDTLGELSAAWGLADVAFVGGSLTSRGGQNMLEPAGYGAAVLFGPDTRNFREIVSLLLEHNAALVVHSAADLTRRVDELLSNRGAASAMGRRARDLVAAHRGATDCTVQLIESILPTIAAIPRAA